MAEKNVMKRTIEEMEDANQVSFYAKGDNWTLGFKTAVIVCCYNTNKLMGHCKQYTSPLPVGTFVVIVTKFIGL